MSLIQQHARSPSSAHPPNTTTMSVSSASPPSRRTAAPRRTALRSVSAYHTISGWRRPGLRTSWDAHTVSGGGGGWPAAHTSFVDMDINDLKHSLPPRPLRNPMRRAQAVVRPQISRSIQTTRPPPVTLSSLVRDDRNRRDKKRPCFFGDIWHRRGFLETRKKSFPQPLEKTCRPHVCVLDTQGGRAARPRCWAAVNEQDSTCPCTNV